MAQQPRAKETAEEMAKERDLINRIRGIAYAAAMLGLLFVSYGDFNWREAWLFIAITIPAKVIFERYLSIKDPELLNRRKAMQPGTKRWDKIWFGFYIPSFWAILVIAGLDAGRLHWSSVPIWAVALGAVSYITSTFFTFWAMTINTHFEGTVRIQKDRDHKVVTHGPYGIVRHPGYLAIIGIMLSLPLVLGSLLAYIPAITVVLLFIIRTFLEDRTLRRELNGYREYTIRVRYRLVPGVW